jgi:hypothetical protein
MKIRKAKVTQQGLVLPKEMLGDVEEVEIKEEDHRIVIYLRSGDPILNLGKRPVDCGTPDGSENHDDYLYESDS